MGDAAGRVGRRAQTVDWHTAPVTNTTAEAADNLTKRVKRAAFGGTDFANYRIRAMLYTGRPNWALLDPETRRAAYAVASRARRRRLAI